MEGVEKPVASANDEETSVFILLCCSGGPVEEEKEEVRAKILKNLQDRVLLLEQRCAELSDELAEADHKVS